MGAGLSGHGYPRTQVVVRMLSRRARALALVLATTSAALVRAQHATEPTLFAPGAVSTAAPEFSLALWNDGASALFVRASDARDRFTLLAAELDRGRWRLTPPPPTLTAAAYIDPFITADGRRLCLTSARSDVVDDPPHADFDLWLATRRGAGWSEPARLSMVVNSTKSEVYCSLSAEGDLYFASDRDGPMRVFVAESDGRGGWRHARQLPLRVAADVAAINPLISASGRVLVFAAALPDTLGGLDLYVAERQGEASDWSVPRNLGSAVNSAYADFAPAWGPGERDLYFTSERPGLAPARTDGRRPPGDIYRVPTAPLRLSW